MTDGERDYVLNEAAQAICQRCSEHDHIEYQADPQPDYWHGAVRCAASRIHCLKRYG